MELWKSDGTNAGTVMVKDINPGTSSSSIGYITALEQQIYFVASNGSNGVELWKSDGTEAGTVMVKDIRTGSASSFPSGLMGMNQVLYFSATDGINGAELWRSDGSSAGTTLLKNIHPSGSSSPQYLVEINGIIYFSADDGTNGRELWRTDGTAEGTYLLKDIAPGSSSSSPGSLVKIGSTLFFSANDGINGVELWKSDGTAAGTVMVKDIWTGGSESYPYNLRNVGGTLFFSADNGANGMELWKSDGTSAGTVLVKDVWPGTPSGASGNFAGMVNQLVFTGNDGVNGDKTWVSDGTSEGTRISSISTDPGTGTVREIQETDVKIYASIQEPTMGRELYGLDFSVVLPLIWLEFDGDLVQKDVKLSWKTVQEENTQDFVVERSTNGRDFVAVGRVSAINSPGTHAYQHSDPDVLSLGAPVVYYRLRQNDLFGRFSYSTVIAIYARAQSGIRLFPVPATDKVWVVGDFRPLTRVNYQVYDNSGKMVATAASVPVDTGRMEVDISKLVPGIYYLRVQEDRFDKRFRIVKR